MNSKTRINVNVDKELKEDVSIILNAIGIDLTAAINIYLKKIKSTKSIPFPLDVKTHYSIEEVAGLNWRAGLDKIEDEWE